MQCAPQASGGALFAVLAALYRPHQSPGCAGESGYPSGTICPTGLAGQHRWCSNPPRLIQRISCYWPINGSLMPVVGGAGIHYCVSLSRRLLCRRVRQAVGAQARSGRSPSSYKLNLDLISRRVIVEVG